jgi:hypothetical protein
MDRSTKPIVRQLINAPHLIYGKKGEKRQKQADPLSIYQIDNSGFSTWLMSGNNYGQSDGNTSVRRFCPYFLFPSVHPLGDRLS